MPPCPTLRPPLSVVKDANEVAHLLPHAHLPLPALSLPPPLVRPAAVTVEVAAAHRRHSRPPDLQPTPPAYPPRHVLSLLPRNRAKAPGIELGNSVFPAADRAAVDRAAATDQLRPPQALA